MIDIIVIAVIVLIVGAAVAYIIKAKKSGKKCIGCPDGCSCGKSKNSGDCSSGCCECQGKEDK
ncbi:MAG: FeoB-associated Cys-rich membrane protein [Ruminococcaceae bacterium]|nr:FeoB-associated Cys-rich membrane protein [Oscillospiraceae bacterium]